LVPWSDSDPSDQAEPAADPTLRLSLDRALARLTARQRTVLVLRYYEDLSHEQVAAAMGCSVSTSKSQTHHALARLRVLAPELAEAFGDDARDGRTAEVTP
jgi:RNA polymerase sigma factor (sigma-70 family)